jgi:hypothetical protein
LSRDLVRAEDLSARWTARRRWVRIDCRVVCSWYGPGQSGYASREV